MASIKKRMGKVVTAMAVRLSRKLNSWKRTVDRLSMPEFANRPRNLKISQPVRLAQPQNIRIGDDVSIGPGSYLKTVVRYPGRGDSESSWGVPVQEFKPELVIGNRVSATSALQLSALESIVIEDDVMFAANVFVCDGLHGYENTDVPYKYQAMGRVAPIRIGKASWIGQNVVIMPGVTIGEFSIIGANSVVSRDIPERCIAVGNPARVIKRWDEEEKRWVPYRAENGA